DKPVLDAQPVMGERRLVEEMSELAVELGIFVIGDLQDPVLDAERIGVVLAKRIALDLGRPAVEILAVEQRNPALFGRLVLPPGVDRPPYGDDEDRERAQREAQSPNNW